MKVDLRKTLFILPNLFTLSSVLCGYYAILILSDQPQSDDFYRAAHSRVYDAILTLWEKNEAIDLITVTEALKAAGALQAELEII